MSSYGISCQSAWGSLTYNPPQHTPIYSLHTPSWMRQPDNTHWISEYLAFACHHRSIHGEKKNSAFLPKKILAPFLLSIPRCSLGNILYQKKKVFSFLFSYRFLSRCCHCQHCLSMSLCLVLLELCPLNLPLWKGIESPVNHRHPSSSPGVQQEVVSGFAGSAYRVNFSVPANCWPVNMQIHTGE